MDFETLRRLRRVRGAVADVAERVAAFLFFQEGVHVGALAGPGDRPQQDRLVGGPGEVLIQVTG